MNILFLTISAGGGHSKASEAISEYIEKSYPNSQTKIIDTYKYVSPIVDKVIIGGYLKTLKQSPKLWGKIYEIAETEEKVNDFSIALNKMFSFKINSLIEEFKPHAIVCTHPFPLQMVCNLKKNEKINIPIVNIITDYACHFSWLNKYVDAYMVANEGLKCDLIKRGVEDCKIFPFGIPVNSDFLESYDKDYLLESYGLENKPTFLLMGGSLGMGEIKKLFISFLKNEKDCQIIIVCGKNTKLKKQLENVYAKNPSKKVLILGFTNKIHELMNISDFIITKPGGLTITEAFIIKIPIIIISPIPGQEERNASFLLNNGAAIRLDNVDNLDAIFYHYIDNPLRVKHMKEIEEYLAKPNAVKDISHFLYNLSNKDPINQYI